MKPMLAAEVKDTSRVKFPVLASPKVDGIRCLTTAGQPLTRSLKVVPNLFIQRHLRLLPPGFDGELVVGGAGDDPYRRTVSGVMSAAGEPDYTYWVFDIQLPGPYKERLAMLRKEAAFHQKSSWGARTCVLEQEWVHNEDQLRDYEESCLSRGFEGAILRDPNAAYKDGRSTEREGALLKLKRFADAEAVVVGFQEQQENRNTAKTNALGHTERSSHKAGKVGKGTLGALLVEGLNGPYKGVRFSVGTGMDDALRAQLWEDGALGDVVKYKYFPTGSKEAPRFPVFLGFRAKEDMS